MPRIDRHAIASPASLQHDAERWGWSIYKNQMDRWISSIEQFERFLQAAGFDCIQRVEKDSEYSMGYRAVKYRRSGIEVVVERDRGSSTIRIGDLIASPANWFLLSAFTYLPGQIPKPRMTFDEHIAFAKAHLPWIIDGFSPSRHVQTVSLLKAAAEKRAVELFTVWPTKVIALEAFLKKNGLICTFRSKPKKLAELMLMRLIYADDVLLARISSSGGWHIDFAAANEPNVWYGFQSMRRLMEWPLDRKIPYNEMFGWIEQRWTQIVDVLRQPSTHEQKLKLDALRAEDRAEDRS